MKTQDAGGWSLRNGEPEVLELEEATAQDGESPVEYLCKNLLSGHLPIEMRISREDENGERKK
ncbi:hypothetical protein GCM10027294_21400 [Marinactinospora endophytica]